MPIQYLDNGIGVLEVEYKGEEKPVVPKGLKELTKADADKKLASMKEVEAKFEADNEAHLQRQRKAMAVLKEAGYASVTEAVAAMLQDKADA